MYGGVFGVPPVPVRQHVREDPRVRHQLLVLCAGEHRNRERHVGEGVEATPCIGSGSCAGRTGPAPGTRPSRTPRRFTPIIRSNGSRKSQQNSAIIQKMPGGQIVEVVELHLLVEVFVVERVPGGSPAVARWRRLSPLRREVHENLR